MIRWLLAAVAALVLAVAVHPASARPIRGSTPASCPKGAIWGDGCVGAPPDGSVYFPNFFTDSTTGYVRHGVARQSGQSYSVTPPYDVAGVSFKVGYSLTQVGGALKDASVQSKLPAGCTYNATGNAIGGPLVQCIQITNPDLEGFDFNKDGSHCIALQFGGGGSQNQNTGNLTLKNNHFQDGLGCSIVYSTGASSGQGDVFQGYISGNTLCVTNANPGTQGAFEVPGATPWAISDYTGASNNHLIYSNTDGTTEVVAAGGSCPSGGTAYTLTVLQNRGSPSSPLTITEATGSGNVTISGYLTGTTLCDVGSPNTTVVPASGGYTITSLDGQGHNILLANTAVTASGGTCTVVSGSQVGTPYTISTPAADAGTNAAPLTIDESTPTLYVTSIAGVNGNTLASGVSAGHGVNIQGQDYLKQNNDFTLNQAISGRVGSCSPSCTSPTTIQVVNVDGVATPGFAPAQNVTFGNNVSNLVSSVNNGNAFTNVLVTQNEFDGAARDSTCCSQTMTAIGILNISGDAKFTYNGVFDFRGRPISFPPAGNLIVAYNYVEGFAWNPDDGHSEVLVDTECCATLPSIQWLNNTILLPTDVMPGGTAPIWADTGNVGQTITQTTLQFNTVVVNLHGGAGGVAEMSGVVEADYATYANMTLDRNYLDGQSYNGQPTCFKTRSVQSSMTAALTNGNNYDLVTGYTPRAWGYICSHQF